jgi:hypothetical protein
VSRASEKFTVDYFINKFEAIPEEKWCIGEFINQKDQCCALGHCGRRLDRLNGLEDSALVDLILIRISTLRPLYGIVSINDGDDPNYPQATPKQRVLAALRDIKLKREATV